MTSVPFYSLDEPTSGLDAATSKMILEVLSHLACEGRTVISTIHQGRSDLYPYYGNILLLAKGGHVAYSGSAEEMLPHFAELGYACPLEMNPSDFALDLVSIDLRETHKEEIGRQKVKTLTAQYEAVTQEDTYALALSGAGTHADRAKLQQLTKIRKSITPFHIAYPILLRRGGLNLVRRPNMAAARIGQILAIGIIITLFFAPLSDDYFRYVEALCSAMLDHDMPISDIH